ncbi:MAG: hypothetical protein O3A29_17530 [Planctomycetota bacterium]|nr:hypothetical protein [Planctomycetota bacterium]
MKAPKGSAPPKSAGTSPKAAATRSGTARSTTVETGTSDREKSTAKADPDDPFAFDSSITEKGVVPLLPRPQKGRSYKIICPMCETPGFSSTKAAGKQVKCANPKCMVPIFTAPALEKRSEPTASEEPESKTGRYLMLATVSVVVIGVGVWFSIQEEPRQPVPREERVEASTTDNTEKVEEKYFENLTRAKTASVDYSKLTNDEIRDRAFESLISASNQRENNRSQTLCRRLAAESFATIGMLKKADEQLALVKKDTRLVAYFPIPPLVEIAWLHLEQNKPNDAATAVEQAQQYAGKLPRRGRTTEIITTRLAAVLAGTGQIEAAKKLLDRLPSQAESDNLGILTRLSLASGEYDLDRLAKEIPLIPWNSANEVIVTADLARHRQWKATEAWVRSLGDDVTKMEALAQWGEVQIRLDDDKSPQAEALSSMVAELSPAAKSFVWSRMSQQYARSGNATKAQSLIDQAHQELSTLPPSEPMMYSSSKEIHGLSAIQFSQVKLLQMRAWGELAFAEALIPHAEQSWEAVSRTLDYCRGLAPSPTAMQNRLAGLKGNKAEQLRNELRQSLDLKTEDQARLAVTKYQRNLDLLDALSEQRFQFQLSILDRASEWNLGPPLVDEIMRRSSATDENEHEPYLLRELPQWILFRARKSPEEEQFPHLQEALVQAGATADPRVALAEEIRQAIASENYDVVQQLFNRSRADKEWVNLWTLQLACRLCRERSPEIAVRFLLNQGDLAAREEGFYFIGGTAAQENHLRDFWKMVQTEKLVPTETAYACAGLIAGLTATPAAKK